MKTRIVKMKDIVIVFCSLIVFTSGARAEGFGLYVEPAVTYEAGDTSINYPSPLTNSAGRVEGLGLGARIGFHLMDAFIVALDLRYAMPQFKDSSVNYDAKSTATNFGPVVAFQMPIVGLRVWGSYVLTGELNPEASGSVDVKFQDATGYRVGAGFRILMLSLNLEYQQIKYGKANLEQLGPFIPGTIFDNVSLENKTWIGSVSFPMEF